MASSSGCVARYFATVLAPAPQSGRPSGSGRTRGVETTSQRIRPRTTEGWLRRSIVVPEEAHERSFPSGCIAAAHPAADTDGAAGTHPPHAFRRRQPAAGERHNPIGGRWLRRRGFALVGAAHVLPRAEGGLHLQCHEPSTGPVVCAGASHTQQHVRGCNVHATQQWRCVKLTAPMC